MFNQEIVDRYKISQEQINEITKQAIELNTFNKSPAISSSCFLTSYA